MPRQRRRDRLNRDHSGAPLIGTRSEALVCVVGSAAAVLGGVMLVVGFLTRDKDGGVGGRVISGFVVLAIGVILVEVVLMFMRRRRSDHFPSFIEYILATRPKRRRALDRRIARVRSFFAAVKFLLGKATTSPRPNSDQSQDPQPEAPATR